jgi:hypothetical protein
MNNIEFLYWLQGFFEIRNNDKPLTKEQALIIRDHIKEIKGEDFDELDKIIKKKVKMEEDANVIISYIDGALEYYDPINGNTDPDLTFGIQDKVQGFFTKVTPDRGTPAERGWSTHLFNDVFSSKTTKIC